MKRRKIIIYIINGVSVILGFNLFSCHSISVNSLSKQSIFTVQKKSGDLLMEIENNKKLALRKNSNSYQSPTKKELQILSILAKNLIDLDIENAAEIANNIDYEIINFFDTKTRQEFYILKEKKIRGWGSYIINKDYQVNALIEAPHILHDQYSLEIAASVFLQSGARGFLMAGAHRHTNGKGSADVCQLNQSIFQVFHEQWINFTPLTYQIHGFSAINHQFPTDTQVVLSNGQGSITAEILILEQKLETIGFTTYIYNHLSKDDLLNQQINNGIRGKTFAPLAATQNRQGQACHQKKLSFIHLEIERKIRLNKDKRQKVTQAIASSFSNI